MASPFASYTTSDPIPLPFDEGQWIKVRALTGQEHEDAQEAHRAAFVSGRSNLWALQFRRALEHGASDPEVLNALADPLTGYDRYALARAGLVEWSYKSAINAKEPLPEEYDAIRDLKDGPIEFIAREVLKLTKPELFMASVAEAEADRKNATGSSTAA